MEADEAGREDRRLLPIFHGLLNDVDPATRETVMAAIGTEQDSYVRRADSRRQVQEPPGSVTTDH